MRLPLSVKEKAIRLRKNGYSLSEIATKLTISKSTCSLWLNNIPLPERAIKRLAEKKILGQYKTVLLRQEKRRRQIALIEQKATKNLKRITLSTNLSKLLCAMVYYCEGVKGSDKNVTFINSDPSLIRLFLSLFRKAFLLNESKFRLLMHLHTYHSERTQKLFWSKTTDIPINQFMHSYRKPNTQKRLRENYQGCVSIRYYDAIIAKELLAYYRTAAKLYS